MKFRYEKNYAVGLISMETEKNSDIKNHEQGEQQLKQEAHKLTNSIFNSLKKDYFIIGKRRVKGWHAWLSIGMVIGIISGVVLVANRTARFEASKAIIVDNSITDKYEQTNIIGESWAYDPSVEYGDDNTGWLAYSSAPEIKPGLVETYLAKTNDAGKTWTKINKIDEAKDVVLQEKGLFSIKKTLARQRHETPTLLYDPFDPDPEKRWKIFWAVGYSKLPSKIGDINKDTIWQYTQVFYKHASSPEKLADAKEIRLFGSKWLNNCLSEICRVKFNLNDLHPDLADTAFYMEPGSLVKNGIIYLTLTAASVKRLQRTILISSSDHGQTWNYIGELTNKYTLEKDVDKNYTPEQLLLTSSSLAEENGRQFLLVSPRNRGGQGQYNGVYIFEFDDITRGKLKRNSAGKLVVHKYLPAISSELTGGGQSEYHEKNTYGGIIMSQTDNSKLGQKEFFKVYNTKERIEAYHTLNITISGQGAGIVISTMPADILCGHNLGDMGDMFGDIFDDCSEDYAFGAQVTLHPTVVHGFFAGWSGDPDCSDGIVTMNASKTCDARFELPIDPKPYERISIIGETSNKGIFDPSVEYNKDGSVGYLVYSGLEQPENDIGNPFPKYIHTHFAKSIDNGKTWRFVKRINESSEDTMANTNSLRSIGLNEQFYKGVWHHEVPTLVYVPDDKGKEWKLFWMKYFSIKNPREIGRIRVPEYLWIMMKEANSPENLDTSEEKALFSTSLAIPKAKFNLNQMLNNDFTFYAEPGTFYKDGVLYISLTGANKDNPDGHLSFLMASNDFGGTWRFVNTLTNKKDAEKNGFSIFAATSLAEENGRVFLLSTPLKDDGSKEGVHSGTFIFEFDSISEGKLKRNADGNLIIIKYLKWSTKENFNSGESTYHKFNTNGGIIMPQADLDSAPAIGQIFNTREKIMEPPIFQYDVDGDGDVDLDDRNMVVSAIGTTPSGPDDPRDINKDGRINSLDVFLLQQQCTRPGCAVENSITDSPDDADSPVFQYDVDGDGDVDWDDRNIVVSALGTAPSGSDDPRDINKDGRINSLDVFLLQQQCTRPGCAVK